MKGPVRGRRWATAGDGGSTPGSRRPSGGGSGSPLQSSCLENPTDRGARWGRKEPDITECLNSNSTKQNEGTRTSKTADRKPRDASWPCWRNGCSHSADVVKSKSQHLILQVAKSYRGLHKFHQYFYVTVRKFSRVGAILLKYLYLWGFGRFWVLGNVWRAVWEWMTLVSQEPGWGACG